MRQLKPSAYGPTSQCTWGVTSLYVYCTRLLFIIIPSYYKPPVNQADHCKFNALIMYAYSFYCPAQITEVKRSGPIHSGFASGLFKGVRASFSSFNVAIVSQAAKNGRKFETPLQLWFTKCSYNKHLVFNKLGYTEQSVSLITL